MRYSFHPVDQARARAEASPSSFDDQFGSGVFLLVAPDLFRPHFNALPNTLDTQEGAPVSEAETDGVLVRVPDEALSSGGRVVLGRHPDNHVALFNASVSSRHLELWRDGEALLCADLDSLNGSSIRGVPLTAGAPERLSHGDTLRLGSVAVAILFGERLRDWLLQGR